MITTIRDLNDQMLVQHRATKTEEMVNRNGANVIVLWEDNDTVSAYGDSAVMAHKTTGTTPHTEYGITSITFPMAYETIAIARLVRQGYRVAIMDKNC